MSTIRGNLLAVAGRLHQGTVWIASWVPSLVLTKPQLLQVLAFGALRADSPPQWLAVLVVADHHHGRQCTVVVWEIPAAAATAAIIRVRVQTSSPAAARQGVVLRVAGNGTPALSIAPTKN